MAPKDFADSAAIQASTLTSIQSGRHARILIEADIPAILNLERKLLAPQFEDSMLAEMHEWHARWRKECLEHYVPKAWCFGIFEGEQLKAYFLAQVLLFFQSNMQVMWLEHLQTDSEYVPGADAKTQASHAEADKKYLLEIAYKYAREKHLQKLVFDNQDWIAFLPGSNQYSKNNALIEVATTKSL